MRVRFDSVFASSVLWTMALLWLVPHNLQYAATWPRLSFREGQHLWVQNHLAPIGFASLAFVVVGLIVVWAGYIRRQLWTWFVMFVIAWGFVFPVYVFLPVLLPAYRASEPIDWSGWFWRGVRESGVDRAAAKGPLDSALMVLALLLGVKPFFGSGRSPAGH